MRTRRPTERHLDALACIEPDRWVILTMALSGEDNVGTLVRGATYNVWDILERYYQQVHSEPGGTNIIVVGDEPRSTTTRFVTPSAVSVVICTEPR